MRRYHALSSASPGEALKPSPVAKVRGVWWEIYWRDRVITRAHTLAQTCTHTHPHTHARTHTHTHTRARAHTYPHTHTRGIYIAIRRVVIEGSDG